jgi:hypothetical protein
MLLDTQKSNITFFAAILRQNMFYAQFHSYLIMRPTILISWSEASSAINKAMFFYMSNLRHRRGLFIKSQKFSRKTGPRSCFSIQLYNLKVSCFLNDIWPFFTKWSVLLE